jgi:hypothetical protein
MCLSVDNSLRNRVRGTGRATLMSWTIAARVNQPFISKVTFHGSQWTLNRLRTDTRTLLIFHVKRETMAFTYDLRLEIFRNRACWTRNSIRQP